jgi:hypothetical protein
MGILLPTNVSSPVMGTFLKAQLHWGAVKVPYYDMICLKNLRFQDFLSFASLSAAASKGNTLNYWHE